MIHQIEATKVDDFRLYQGDIISNVRHIESYVEVKGNIRLSQIFFPLAIVLTQDCDLESEHLNRGETIGNNALISVLLAPIYNAEHLRAGSHLMHPTIDLESASHSSRPWTQITNNNNTRYHYLQFPDAIKIVPSVIDFKHYFSVDVNALKAHREKHYICTVDPLFREDISHRFAYYLSRIGLPEPAAQV